MKRLVRDEKGYILILVLVLLVVGGLVLTPLLGLMSTGLLSGRVYENSMYRLYAADAGVEDALWRIENEKVADLFPDYDEYDYHRQWGYNLSEHVNDKDVTVTIENVWMPMDITAPDKDTARDIIEEAKMIMTGSPALIGTSTYEIKIYYDPCGGTPAVETIGIWLPSGFGYAGNCSLEGEDYYSEPTVTVHKGGKAVVWSFSPPVSLDEFPSSFTFQYAGPEGQIPSAAFSWMDTDWEDTIPGYTWDADVKVYRIVSTASDPNTETQTTIESYTATVELRKLGAALSGDYHAIGNTLMTPEGGPITGYHSERYRDVLFRESSATLAEGDIPASAIIEAAFLYWSGWIEEAAKEIIWGPEDCSNFVEPIMDWTAGSAWETYNGRFRGTAYDKPDPGRYLTMSSSIDLSAYAGQTVEVSWQQDEDGSPENEDRLYFAFSNNGGSSWGGDVEAFRGNNPESPFTYTIPDEYLTNNFRMRFHLDGFNDQDCYRSFLWWCLEYGPEYCYIDNITISVSGESCVENAKVNRVMFGTTDNMTQITAALDDCQVEPTPDSTAPESWSYSCFYDVTENFTAMLDPDTKSGNFTLGHVIEGSGYTLYDPVTGNPSGEETGYPLATPAQDDDTQYHWTYAGWSLLIIYSSPETKGHQLYLFDTFRYVGEGGDPDELSFSISGFLAPDDTTGSHLTYFVGEGDDHWTGDSIEVNGDKMPQPGDPYEPYEGFNPQNNVFNSLSNSLDNPYLSGVDIDTFDMSNCIGPGDTSAEVLLITEEGAEGVAEIYNLVYIVLSFRSLVTGGGVMGYLIWG